MQPKLTVRMVPTADLVPYAGNAKEHPDWQVGQIAASIEQFGFDDPVGIWHNEQGHPVIVEGHGRVLAAKELGIEQVPTIAPDNLDDEGRRAYTLAHNKLTTNTGYDARRHRCRALLWQRHDDHRLRAARPLVHGDGARPHILRGRYPEVGIHDW